MLEALSDHPEHDAGYLGAWHSECSQLLQFMLDNQPMLLWLQALAANLNADLLHTFCNRDLDNPGLMFGLDDAQLAAPLYNPLQIQYSLRAKVSSGRDNS
jgi:hypothetical protein